jgi:cyclophilin family peptidyl-prolyl cis-trans isomerase
VQVAGAVAAAVALAALLATAGRQALAVRQSPATAVQTPGASLPGLAGILAVEDARAPFPDDVRALLAAAGSDPPEVQRAAVRALGRLERRDLIPELLLRLRARDPGVAQEAAVALALAMRGEPLPGASDEQQSRAVLDALALPGGPDTTYLALGRLPHTTAAEFRQAERELARGLATTPAPIEAVRGLESLARLNRKFLPLDDSSLERLRSLAVIRNHTRAPELRRNAMAALVAALGADTPTLVTALADDEAEVRRLAALALAGAGSTVEGARRVELLREALSDRSPMVRLEALKGWVRWGVGEHGCGRVMSALADPEPHVFLHAMDALGEQCKDDVVVTDRITAEARPPSAAGAWQREAHAIVALAKRAPDRAALALTGFLPHSRWQVRMYAARAASIINDAASLGRLAQDEQDNVREAALPALRRLLGPASDDAFVAALQRPDYQLLRTAARELKGSAPSQPLAGALTAALARVTAERKETSRDIRTALIERLGELGSPTDGAVLRALLRDFDPVVAAAAAGVLQRWTGEEVVVLPELLPRAPLPDGQELAEAVHAVVSMESGGSFTLRFMAAQAPLARTRFLRLARARYYDGLTFHRVVANAFIQGGSPGANEYAGDRLYMRDEVGLEMHTRGSVGISTRGRDTGDAQIFINLVDNPFLDFQYTVFARVCGAGMDAVDRIQEGDRIRRVQVAPGDRCE